MTSKTWSRKRARALVRAETMLAVCCQCRRRSSLVTGGHDCEPDVSTQRKLWQAIQINKSLSASVFSRFFRGANTKMQNRRNLPLGTCWKPSFMFGMNDMVVKQRELVQEEEKSSGCRTFSNQGLSGLKGDPQRNAVRHLKNTFSPAFVIDDNSEPCEEAGSTAKQEQARKMRRCRLRGIKRRIGADESARRDPTWPTTLGRTAENRPQIKRNSILRTLDVLLSQVMVGRQGGDAFKAAGTLHGERKRRHIRPRYSAALVSKGFKPATLGNVGEGPQKFAATRRAKRTTSPSVASKARNTAASSTNRAHHSLTKSR